MKNEFENIEQLFKDRLENFETDVNPSVWNNVQQTVQSQAANSVSSAGSQAGTVAAKSTLFKIAVTTITTAAVVTSSVIIYNTFIKENNTSKKIITNSTTSTSTSTSPEAFTNNEQPIVITNQKEKENTANTNNEKIEQPTVNTNISSQKVEKTEKQTHVTQNEGLNTTEKTINTPTATTEEKTSLSSTENITTSSVPTSVTSKTNENTTVPSSTSPNSSLAGINFNASTLKGDAPLYVEFSAEGKANEFYWDFNDGGTKTGENVFHTFETPGVYQVMLTATDENGKEKTISHKVEVFAKVKSSLAEIPNIFTPNGDGKNDVLKVEGENIKEFKAMVLNTSGNTIFEWNTIDGFWDGNDMQNQLVPNGTYFLVIRALGSDNQPYEIKKAVTLRR